LSSDYKLLARYGAQIGLTGRSGVDAVGARILSPLSNRFLAASSKSTQYGANNSSIAPVPPFVGSQHVASAGLPRIFSAVADPHCSS